MSDYTARRDAGIDATLAAIDAAIPTCLTCGAELSPNGKSDLFCGQHCQERGLASQAEEQVPEGWRAYDMDRETPAPNSTAPTRPRRLYLNNPVAAELLGDIERNGASTDDILDAADRLAEAMGEAGATIRVHIPAATTPNRKASTTVKPIHTCGSKWNFRLFIFAAVASAITSVLNLVAENWILAGVWAFTTALQLVAARINLSTRRLLKVTCRACKTSQCATD